MRKIVLAMAAAVASISLAACGEESAPNPNKITQAQKAQQAAESVAFNENAEIDNIKNRLELTSNPGALGFVLLLNEAGQPIAYYGVKGKITSSGKRLTPTQIKARMDCGQYCSEVLADAPSDEGTYGSSDPYVYFWTTSGQYVQWNGKYLYSDKPFRTRVEPLVIATQ